MQNIQKMNIFPTPHSPLLLPSSPKFSYLECSKFPLQTRFLHSSCPTVTAMMAVMVETMAAAVIATIITTKKKQRPLRWHRQQWLWRRPRQRKAMADATSVNCNGKHIYGNNNGNAATGTVTATTKAAATATATTKAMVAMWWQWWWWRQWRRQQRRLKSWCSVWLWCGVLWCWYMLYYCDPVTSGMWIRRKIFCKFFLLHALRTSTNVLCGFGSRCFCWTSGLRLLYIIGNS